MATPLAANPYSKAPVNFSYSQAPQRPPSPPGDESQKCSLPSISSLLDIASGGQSPRQEHASDRAQSQPLSGHAGRESQNAQAYQPHHVQPGGANPSRVTLPPTPPMRPDSVFDGTQSPSASSQRSSSSAPGQYFAGSAINNVDASHQRQPASAISSKRPSMPSSAPSFASSPSQQSAGSYYSPSNPPTSSSSVYYQRPLPQSFPPPAVPVTVTPSSGAYPVQHHHYISPTSQAAFPQSQDRYICAICNKAFSRPSSLRIHSHSHTGEKPFKCPHHGCGKAFSVRSNMKRHERGCHSTSPNSM
ncbi:MAG: hypothetical protein M4579_004675 [Chaenotheca gracillima]|nr:MAG: hypothetical protein M4579_004675 [Chaenotheca gracillima]